MMDIDEKTMKQLEQKFSEYKTYYEILAIRKENVTNDIVENAFKYQKKQLEGMLKRNQGKNVEKIRNLILTTLENAYNALKDENSRKHYEELLLSIQGEER